LEGKGSLGISSTTKMSELLTLKMSDKPLIISLTDKGLFISKSCQFIAIIYQFYFAIKFGLVVSLLRLSRQVELGIASITK
jgi:hypothetical protein